jgi:uncharacterized membrane protein
MPNPDPNPQRPGPDPPDPDPLPETVERRTAGVVAICEAMLPPLIVAPTIWLTGRAAGLPMLAAAAAAARWAPLVAITLGCLELCSRHRTDDADR